MIVNDRIIIRWLNQQKYLSCWHKMQSFTNDRHDETTDEIWLLQHEPVFTQGQNGKIEHVLAPQNIPVIQTDRGGQITYHGPGQLMVYILIDLKRKKITIRELVTLLENAIIDFLADHKIKAYGKREAPGVYVLHHNEEMKICSIGLRVKRGCTYHGLAFNIDMNLEPFSRINPCGYAHLKMTQLASLTSPCDFKTAAYQLMTHLIKKLGYTTPTYIENSNAE